jgi:hypothetical protein
MAYYSEIHLTPYQRDQMIVELRRRGYTYRAIGKRVGMSANGVMHALRRLKVDGPGTRWTTANGLANFPTKPLVNDVSWRGLLVSRPGWLRC